MVQSNEMISNMTQYFETATQQLNQIISQIVQNIKQCIDLNQLI